MHVSSFFHMQHGDISLLFFFQVIVMEPSHNRTLKTFDWSVCSTHGGAQASWPKGGTSDQQCACARVILRRRGDGHDTGSDIAGRYACARREV